MKKYIVAIFLLITIAGVQSTALSRSWDDLDEGEHEIYGSEREEKFPIKALFIEKEEWENHYSFMLFWLYKHTDYPRYSSTRFIPFYYGLDSKIDNRSLTVFPILFTWFETDGKEETTHFVFPLYNSTVSPNESTRNVLYLFWWGNDRRYNRDESYQVFVPLLFFHFNDSYPDSDMEKSLWINPLFVSWREKDDKGDDTESLWWFPIIPVTFHYVDRYEGHRNFFWLIDYSWDIEKGEDKMRRFWFFPFYMWSAGDDGYTALNPVYLNNRHSNGDWYYHLLPLFMRWKETDSANEYREFATLLFSSYSETDRKTGEEIYSNFWFPIIPLFYRSSDKNLGTHTNILWLLDWESDTSGSLSSFWFFPFIFHKSGEGGYKYILPFYCRPSGTTEEEGYTFGLFHYHSWYKNGSTTWSWPYYHSEERVAKPAVKGSTEPAGFEEYWYTHFIPLYWSWRSPESRGKLILPLYYSYRDKQTKLHVNLLGVARKTYMGPFNPDVSVGLANKDDRWYFDTDWSWFYDLWSFSARVPIRNPFASKGIDPSAEIDEDMIVETDPVARGESVIADTEIRRTDKKRNDIKKSNKKDIASAGDGNGSAIKKKKEMTRENSEYFWGWKLLFGWMAYEHADSKRHFRLLPLAWLTWDRESSDRLYTFLPFFLWYSSEELKEEYFVVAPFYAAQRQEDSYAKAYMVIGYWDEYDSEEELHEKTVLWPFVNWYSSPAKGGFRIFPVVWYRWWIEDNERTSRTFAPLWYSKTVKDINSGETVSATRINPLFYKSEEMHGESSSYSLFAPIIPLFYHSVETDANSVDSVTVTPLFYYGSTSGENAESGDRSSTFWAPIVPLFYRSSEVYGAYSSSLTVNPLYFYSSESEEKSGSVRNSSRFWFPILPLYYRSSYGEYSHWNLLGILDRKTEENYSRFFLLPFYYTTTESGETHRNVLGLIDWWSDSTGVNTSMVLPVYRYSRGEEWSSLMLFPLLSYFGSDSEGKTRFVAGMYWYSSPRYYRQNFLWLFDHKEYIYDDHSRDEYSMFLTTASLDVSPEIVEMRLLWGTLLNWKKYRGSSDYEIDAALWLAGVTRRDDYFHSRVLPIYWYSSEDDESHLVIPPILSYFSEDSSGNFDLGVLGLVYYRNENRDTGEDARRILLGTLYNEVRSPVRGYHSRGSMWGLLWDYETEEETGFTKFTILKGFYKYINKDGEKEHTFLWFI